MSEESKRQAIVKKEVIKEARKVNDFVNNVKRWHRKVNKEAFTSTSILSEFSKGHSTGLADAYDTLLNEVENNLDLASIELIKYLCENYIKSSLAVAGLYSYQDIQITPGSELDDEGYRTLVCPIEIPKEYKKYLEA